MAESSGVLEKILLVIAVAFGTINVIGGFLVTDRMLGMFKAKDPPKADGDRRNRCADSSEGDAVVTARWATCLPAERRLHRRGYIVAFGLMIYGMSGLTGPRTAVRGNQIAAVGMAVAVVATLLRQGEFHGSGTVILIIVGLAIGTAVGVPAARNVKMTAMPQMVALFNGVGGGAVALIAWVEYRHHFGGGWPLRSEGFELFGAIVGSISFWGSNIAFGKLQEILPGRPIKLPGPGGDQRCVLSA